MFWKVLNWTKVVMEKAAGTEVGNKKKTLGMGNGACNVMSFNREAVGFGY